MPTTINRKKDLVVKSADLGTGSILCIISIAKWDTKQVHACKIHGTKLRWHVNMSSENYLNLQMMFTWSCVFKPQGSYVCKWTYPTLQSICDKYRKQEYHWVSLGIPSNFPKRNKMAYFNWVWNWCSRIKAKINLSTSIGNMLLRAVNISTYWCTYQSMNHDKLEGSVKLVTGSSFPVRHSNFE